MSDPLAHASAATRAWFADAFAEPTPAQREAWTAIASGDDTLVVAPTGSGKTLAAFLTAIDRCVSGEQPPTQERCRVLYVSPLKALAADVQRNLRSPLVGISQAAARLGIDVPEVTVGVRTGDTDARERRRLATTPPDIMITTPESLFLMLTSAARESLIGVDTVIIDEIHALAGTKRGAHLAVSLARLDEFISRTAPDRIVQRIGLSATARPINTIAQFLSPNRAVTIVNPPTHKEWDLSVVVPVEDMTDLPLDNGPFDGSAAAGPASPSIWPHVEQRLVEDIERHRSTLVFVNSRRLAERLTASINETWQERHDTTDVLARAHHGSVSHEQRAIIEEDLKSGALRAVVATSSMELGIDMGAIDLVVQVEAPPSVASGLQRVGRAGHQVGEVSRGIVFPKFRADLLQSAVVVERMRAGDIEAIDLVTNPLDVLAQQIVAMVAMEDWNVDDLAAVIRTSAPFATLGDASFESVLDMLAGRYPGEEFAELRPRLVWDRAESRLSGRPGAQRLAVTSGGTIPDRGLFGVYLVGTSMRVGELDEEMVYESRVGDLFALGTSSWRIEDITADRVLVSPAPGQAARLPFWRGDRPGRPWELGEAVGRFLRESDSTAGLGRLQTAGLDEFAAGNLIAYLAEQRAATGTLPDDRTIVVERFRDELGDWRVVVHTPFGARVHAPWALAITARLRDEYGVDAQVMYSDDGIVLRLPDTLDEAAPRAVADLLAFDDDEIEGLVTREVGGSAMFAGRFRECASRALLLPRRTPGRRSPLWQQRQRSAHLLSVASRYPEFPIVAETVRECLRDVFDLPALRRLLRGIGDRTISVVDVHTPTPSPFAQALLFGYVAEFLYDGDAPLAERRAAALTVDTGLLSELLGTSELRELIDADALERTARRVELRDRDIRNHEDAADLLRLLGPISSTSADERGIDPKFFQTLVEQRRAIEVRIAGSPHWAAIEDAGTLRDALGCALPMGIPDAFLESPEHPLRDLIARYARTHGPFTVDEVSGAFGIGVAVGEPVLKHLASIGRLASGGFTPDRVVDEWCDVEVLRRIRRASVAALREQAEPVSEQDFARFLPEWQGMDSPGRGIDALRLAIDQLAGVALPARHLESLVLPTRVRDYSPAMLDSLLATGEVQWWGLGSVPGDAWIALAPIDLASTLRPIPEPAAEGSLAARILSALSDGGAMFFRDLSQRVGSESAILDTELTDALWSLVWSGHITNDSLHPIRMRSMGSSTSGTTRTRVSGHSRTGLGRVGMGRTARRARAPRGPLTGGPPSMSGRWSLLGAVDTDPTVRTLAQVEAMLERFGILARSIVSGESMPGGFAAAYRVLTSLEESGAIRRTFAVEGLGGAQFALPSVIDRLRRDRTQEPPAARVLAAADPAQPYGASLPWPERNASGRPSRAAGAIVVTVDAEPVLWIDRGGASMLTWDRGPQTMSSAAAALDSFARAGDVRFAITRIDTRAFTDTDIDSHVTRALTDHGFAFTPRALAHRGASAAPAPRVDDARG